MKKQIVPQARVGMVFTTTGSDAWKVRAVRIEPQLELENLETGEKRTVGPGEEREFFLVEMPKIPGGRNSQKPRAAKQRTKKEPEVRKGVAGSEAKRRGRRGTSRYFGISFIPKNGRWRAQIKRSDDNWDGGQFEFEELAAAAVHSHLGNDNQAHKLRLIAIEKYGPEAVSDDEGVWLCHGCAEEYRAAKNPDRCEKCGSGTFEFFRKRKAKREKKK